MPSDESASNHVDLVVGEESEGERLDAFLAGRLAETSRVRISTAIDGGDIRVNGSAVKRSYRISAGDQVAGGFSAPSVDGPEPEDIPLDIVYEDEHVAVINKPSDMVVHPSKGHWAGTCLGGAAEGR